MRKYLTVALVLGLLTAGMSATIPAPEAKADLRWDGENWARCSLPYETDHDVQRLIRCAVDHFPTSLGTAMYVAERESGFESWVENATCCSGVYQQHRGYWSGRVADYNAAVPEWLEVAPSILNGRSNVLVSIWMAHQGGWGPWSM